MSKSPHTGTPLWCRHLACRRLKAFTTTIVSAALLGTVIVACTKPYTVRESRTHETSEMILVQELSDAQKVQLARPDQAEFWKEYNVSLVPEPRPGNPTPTPEPAAPRPLRTPVSTGLMIREPAPFVTDEEVPAQTITLPAGTARPLPILAETQPAEKEGGASVIQAGGAIGTPTGPGQAQAQPTPPADMPGRMQGGMPGGVQGPPPGVFQPQLPQQPAAQPTPFTVPAETNYSPQ